MAGEGIGAQSSMAPHATPLPLAGERNEEDQKRSVCTSSDGSSDIRTYWARMWISD